MKIAALADIHGHIATIRNIGEELSRADLVVLAGDLTRFGHAGVAAQVLDAVRTFNPRVLAVTGNCDHPDCEPYLETAGVALNCRRVVFEGVEFFGLSASLPCPFHTLNESTEEEFGARLDAMAQQHDAALPCVLVSHQPPFRTKADHAWIGGHVGSRSVRKFIEQSLPLLCFTGHIHEARSIDQLGPTQIVNPGPWAKGKYAIATIENGAARVELRSA